MFESRLQLIQAIVFPAGLLAGVAIVLFITGPIAVAVFCLVVSHAGAAVGFYFYAEEKGYLPLIGVGLGVSFGVFGGVILLMLPDESADDDHERQRRLARGGIENARNRDKGYEVLDEDED